MRFHKFHANSKSALWRGVVVIYLLFERRGERRGCHKSFAGVREKVVEKKRKTNHGQDVSIVGMRAVAIAPLGPEAQTAKQTLQFKFRNNLKQCFVD